MSKKEKVFIWIGVGFAILQALATVFFMINLHRVDVLPLDYKILVGILLFLFVLITLITQRWKVPSIITRVFAGLLSVIMIVGCFYMEITRRAIDNMSGVTVTTSIVNVYVLKDSEAQDMSDIMDGQVGILGIMDREHTDKVVKEIETENKKSLNLVEYNSLMELVASLYDKSVDAIMVNAGYVEIISDMDDFENFEKETRVLKTIKREEQIGTETKPNGGDEVDDNPLLHCNDGHVIALYISGVDVEGSPNAIRNSDVNILCFINKTTKQIMLLNTPRDFYVMTTIDGGNMDKLTHCGCRGVDCSISTLENFYGVDIDDYLRVNFSGFKQIVDSLGGVNVWSEYEFVSKIGKIHFDRGFNYMDGYRALCFARERRSFAAGDRQRGRNQMEVIKAVIEKMESSDMLLNYQAVLDSISGSMATSMPYEKITELIQFQLKEMPDWKIMQYSVTGDGANEHCYLLGAANYVMIPDENSVNSAKAYISAMYNDEYIDIK